MADAPASSPSSPPDWSPAARVGFRFAFIYVILYILPLPWLWDALVPELGAALFGVEVEIQPNGSGDTTYSYVQLAISAAAAALGALVWSLLDRHRRSYPRLAEALIVVLRYSLAALMLSYGFAKVFVGQFPSPSLETLMRPYGDSSPMRLAWTFMGYSRAYSMFAGLAECLGGLLLFWRRTTTLGALLCAAVMTNVVVMNFCFDIPVKLFASHLLLTALALVALDGRRLVKLLILNEPVEAVERRPHFEGRWARITAALVKGLVVTGLLGLNIWNHLQIQRDYFGPRTRSPIYGIWEVRELVEDGEPRPGLLSEGERWRYLIFDNRRLITVQRVDGSFVRYFVDYDEDLAQFELWPYTRIRPEVYLDPPELEPVRTTWTYARSEPGAMTLAGELDGRELKLELEARDPDDFFLLQRGFHWINEFPMNR